MAPSTSRPIRPRRWFAVTIAATVLAALGSCSSSPEPKPDEPKSKATPTAPSPSAVDRMQLKKVEDARVELDSPDWLASGFGSLSTKQDDGTVVRMSPKGKVQATIDADIYRPPRYSQGLGVSADAVWACGTEGKIVRMDPKTNDSPRRSRFRRSTNRAGWLRTAVRCGC